MKTCHTVSQRAQPEHTDTNSPLHPLHYPYPITPSPPHSLPPPPHHHHSPPAEDIQYLIKLEVLTLSNNLLRSLPKGIAALRNLKVLDLENNRLESLIPDVSYLRNLTKLNIQSNNITYLPRGVG